MEHLLAVLRPHLPERARSVRLGTVAAALGVGAIAIAAGLQLWARSSET